MKQVTLMTRLGSPRRVGLLLAAAVSLAACTLSPAGPKTPTVAPQATKSTSPQAAKSPTPAPIPSLGLLLAGRVTVEPSAILAGKLGRATAQGVTLLSDNGLGLISDNGLGLISDNGLGLIANAGAGYRVAQAKGELRPIKGMHVKAVSLFDGRVLAGPVATDADGRYKLGFLKAPERNMKIVAVVPGQESSKALTYSTLTTPTSTSVVTSDTTRLAASQVLSVLPYQLQPVFELYKNGTPYEVHPSDSQAVKDLAALLARIPRERLVEADKDGALAYVTSERLLALTDLTLPVFAELAKDVEEFRAFAATVEDPGATSLEDQFLAAVRQKAGDKLLLPVLLAHGMPEAQAVDLTRRLGEKGDQIGTILGLTLTLNFKTVMAPIEALAN